MRPIHIIASLGVALLSACSTSPNPSSSLTFPFQALGNEPGWSVRLQYSLKADVILDTGSTRFSTTFTPKRDDDTEWVAQAKHENNILVLRIRPGYCNDTMSDTLYPYQAELTINNEVLQGCGRVTIDL